MEDNEEPLIVYRCNICLDPLDPRSEEGYITEDGLYIFTCKLCLPRTESLFDD